jgi:hypothetical protein
MLSLIHLRMVYRTRQTEPSNVHWTVVKPLNRVHLGSCPNPFPHEPIHLFNYNLFKMLEGFKSSAFNPKSFNSTSR